MKRATLAASVTACLCIGVVVPVLSATPPVIPVTAPATSTPTPAPAGAASTAGIKITDKCLGDLRSFDGQMQKDGYWLGESGFGYGYPMGGNGYGYAMRGPAGVPGAYLDARPGYEVRMLVAAANILARHGQDQACEDTLATTRNIYSLYVADMRSGKYPTANVPDWQQQQIAAALPVTGKDTAFRSDQLVGTDVRGPKNEALGSVDDVVISPQTGKITYLVIARGGFLGFDEKYVAVPWDDFKITPNSNLLVLDATKVALEAAPQASRDDFANPGNFEQKSQAVDAYWKAHISDKG
jgi:sporulation protein YlmC with PRC-barrel domain